MKVVVKSCISKIDRIMMQVRGKSCAVRKFRIEVTVKVMAEASKRFNIVIDCIKDCSMSLVGELM